MVLVQSTVARVERSRPKCLDNIFSPNMNFLLSTRFWFNAFQENLNLAHHPFQQAWSNYDDVE